MTKPLVQTENLRSSFTTASIAWIKPQDDFPLVTIAIPTFNRAALLRECVLSALRQTYTRFEVLVSDNASTDATQETLVGLSDHRLRVIRQPVNIGPMPNWNACLAAAKGDYIVFVSDDDRISPWLLTRCLSVIEGHSEIPVVVTLSNVHSTELQKTFPACTSRHLKTGVHNGTEILLEFLKERITVTMCSVMIRTALLRERRGLPLDLPHTADVAAWAPLLLLGKAGFVNEACATYSYHRQSATARLSVKQLLDDGQKTADLIGHEAAERLADVPKRRLVQIQARRLFACRGVVVLSDYLKNDGGVRALVQLTWQFRGHLKGATVGSVLRLMANIVCPRAVANIIRKLRPTVQ